MIKRSTITVTAAAFLFSFSFILLSSFLAGYVLSNPPTSATVSSSVSPDICPWPVQTTPGGTCWP